MAKRLRAHHILCTKSFQGKGYSDAFAKGMEEQVALLRGDSSIEIEPVATPDAICKNCPHLTEDNICDSNNNDVKKKDETLRKILGIEENRTYTYEELLDCVRHNFTKDDFQKICGDCSWNRAGLCDYDKLIQ